ncbi:uncharacterized protein FN964_010292 isoform 3-T5 [Alca torda]
MTLPRKQEAAIVIPSCLHEEKMGECDQVSEVFVSFVSADSSPLFSITTFSTSATCMHTHTHVMQILNCAINSMNEKSLVCNVMKVWQCHYTSRNAFILKSSFNGTNGAKVVHKSGQNLLSAVNFTEGKRPVRHDGGVALYVREQLECIEFVLGADEERLVSLWVVQERTRT